MPIVRRPAVRRRPVRTRYRQLPLLSEGLHTFPGGTSARRSDGCDIVAYQVDVAARGRRATRACARPPTPCAGSSTTCSTGATGTRPRLPRLRWPRHLSEVLSTEEVEAILAAAFNPQIIRPSLDGPTLASASYSTSAAALRPHPSLRTADCSASACVLSLVARARTSRSRSTAACSPRQARLPCLVEAAAGPVVSVAAKQLE